MAYKEGAKPLHGSVHITAFKMCPDHPDCKCMDIKIKDTTFDNLIVDVGKDTLLKRIGGTGLTGFGETAAIGVGDSTQVAAAADTDLIAACNKTWKNIPACCKTFIRPTVFLSVDFGYGEANYTWNEIGLADDQGCPLCAPACGSLLIARQVDCCPLCKTACKRAIVEWQLTL